MSKGGTYLAGQGVRLSIAFSDFTNTPFDPTTVTLKYQLFGGTEQTPVYGASAIVKDSVGNYHYIVDTTGNPGGALLYEWLGTGNTISADNGSCIIVAAPLP